MKHKKLSKALAFMLAFVMVITMIPANAFAENVVPKENYKINTNKYMTRLHDHWGEAELEFGFVVRFDGEESDRFTSQMGEDLLKKGQIKIDDGAYWTFNKAGIEFAGQDTKSSYLTKNKEFIKEFYQQDTFKITIKTPEGYEIVADNVTNNLDADQKKAFEDSLNKDPQPDPEPEITNEYTVDMRYTFLKDQYGTKVFRIDFMEFTSGTDPRKAEYLANAKININNTDFGKMNDLGFTITNYYGFELADLSKIKSVINDDNLNVVLDNKGKTTSFTVKNELSLEDRKEIAGTPEPETPVESKETIGNAKVKLVKSGKHNEDSMSGPTLKEDAEILMDKDGNSTLVMHYAPAEIMGIIAYTIKLDLDGAETKFVLKEDNTGTGIVKIKQFTEPEKVLEGHVYSSVMDADVALKIQKVGEVKPLKEALANRVSEVESLIKENKYYENTLEPVKSAIEEAKKTTAGIDAYEKLELAVAGLRKILADPFVGDTVFHMNVIDTNNITAKNIEKYAKVEIKDEKKILTVHYNSRLEWNGEIFIESTKVFDQHGKEIPSTYKLDKHHNGVLQFEMPYVPGGGVFDVEHTLGNSKELVKSKIQMDYSTIKKGVFREMLIDAIEKYGKYTENDFNTRTDMANKKDDFTKASWDVFENALNTAKEDLKNTGLTQEKLEEDVVNLKEARANLVYKIKAGNASHANTGISGLNNPATPYYQDPEAEYPEVVGWAGSKVVFGKDGESFRVLDTGRSEDGNSGKILLMSDTLRVKQPFTNNAENTSVRWKDSILRSYMNDDFYNNNFTPIEKAAILKTQINTYDYQDGYMGPPAKDTNSKVTTDDYIFAPDMDIMQNIKYGYISKDSRSTSSEYSLREVFTDMFGEYATLGISSKGRIGGTFGLASKNLNAPVCMNIDSKDILMTIDANTGIPQNLKDAEKIDTNLWKFVMKDANLKLDDNYKATINGNKVSVNVNTNEKIMAVIVEGKDFETGKVKSYGIVNPKNFEVKNFDKDSEKLYVMAIRDEKGKTAYASTPALVNMNKNITPGEPEGPTDPEVSTAKHGTVDTFMKHEYNETASMCDVMFDKKANVAIKDGKASIKLLVANPVPGFKDQGADGTLKNFTITYDGVKYPATSKLNTGAMMTAKATNATFGFEEGKKYAAQEIIVKGLPEEAIKEGNILTVNTYVNVVMMTDVEFRMVLSNVDLKAGESTDPDLNDNVKPVKPGVVQNVNVKTDNGLLKVSFNKVKNATNYKIWVQRVGANGGNGYRWYYGYSNGTMIRQIYKQPLVKNAKYQVKVQAINDGVAGNFSKVKTVYANRIGTKAATMFAPKFASVTFNKNKLKTTTAKVVANKVYVKNTPRNLQYKVSYKIKGAKTWKSAGYSANNVKYVKSLTKGKTYSFALRYRYLSSLDGKTYIYSQVVYRNATVR